VCKREEKAIIYLFIYTAWPVNDKKNETKVKILSFAVFAIQKIKNAIVI
jgi:hypothetical protein